MNFDPHHVPDALISNSSTKIHGLASAVTEVAGEMSGSGASLGSRFIQSITLDAG